MVAMVVVCTLVLPTGWVDAASATSNGVTAVFNPLCSGFGWDVTNTTTTTHTVTVSVDGAPVGAPVDIAPGATVHVALTPPDPTAQVQLRDTDGTVLNEFSMRFCINVQDRSVTIASDSTWTSSDHMSIQLLPPSPRHGVVTVIQPNTLRYTPDPCFTGTDAFGYLDSIEALQGTITVTVLPGTCSVTVRRSAIDCANQTATYTAVNPLTVSARIVETLNGTTRDILVAPKGTTVADAAHATNGAIQVSFRVADATQPALVDTVTFPCPRQRTPTPQLPFTGGAAGPAALIGTILTALGAILLMLNRHRRDLIARQ